NGKKNGIIACKRDTMISAKQSDWMEWQAGYACGAILMPASQLRSVIDSYRKNAGLYGPVLATTSEGQAMISLVEDNFGVSRDAARVRLSVLGFLGSQRTLGSLPL